MNNTLLFGGAFAIAALAFFLRVWPRLKLQDYGIDTWYYLLYVEAIRSKKKVPVRIPYYYLDKQEQWYPPGFPLFLSFFSPEFLRKYQWLLNPVIDCMQLVIVYFVTYFFTHDVIAVLLAGLLYATVPTLISENTNLNSRGLASLTFIMVMLCLYKYVVYGNLLWLVALAAFGVCMALTHKMVMQNFALLMISFFFAYRDVRYLFILGLIFAVAIFCSKGFYLKVLKGHIEILQFWKKNLHNLRSHQVYDSDIYEKPSGYRDTRFHLPGIRGICRYIYAIIVNNNNWYALLLLPFFFCRGSFSPLQRFYFYWVICSYISIVAITFVPFLKFIGESYKYVKFSIFPLAVLFAIQYVQNKGMYLGIFPVLLSFNIISILKIYREMAKHPQGSFDEKLVPVLEYLKKSPKEGVMTIPNSPSDGLAYFTRKKVCWGGHSSNWNKLNEWFPVLKKPVEYFFRKFELSYLLVDKEYVLPKYLKLRDFRSVYEGEKYILYEWTGEQAKKQRKKKIFYFVGTLEIGGAESQMVELASHIDRDRYDPVICAIKSGPLSETARERGIRVEILTEKSLKNPLTIFSLFVRLNRLFTNEEFDFLHTYLFHAYVIGSFFAWLNGVSTIITIRRSLGDFKKPYHFLLEKIINNFVDVVVANSEAVKNDIVKRGKLPLGKIKIIYNGIDVNRYVPSGNTDGLRGELGLPAGVPVIGIIGNLSRYKGHDVFLRAARNVSKEFSEARFLIIGRDVGLADNLKKLAQKLGIMKSVIFTGLRMDVPDLLRLIDVQVVASHEEGFSNVILEGMAASKPMVVTGVGGITEAVVDNVTGIVVPDNDYQSLADAIIRMLFNRDFAASAGAAGRQRVEERFSLEHMVKRTEELYEKIRKDSNE